MLTTHLFEAGIRTAAIDSLARAALGKAIPQAVEQVLHDIEPELPPKKMERHGNHEWEDTSARYDAIYALLQKDQDRIVQPMLHTFSEVLTGVVREYLKEVLPTIKHIRDMVTRQYRGDYSSWWNHFKVVIEAKEGSGDSHAANAGGYFSLWDGLIKVFVSRDDVYRAGHDLILEAVLDEGDDGFDLMLRAIVPIFTHEYAHLEQSLRRTREWRKQSTGKPEEFGWKPQEGNSRDFGYITVGKKNRRHKNSLGGRGGRGEWARTPWSGDEHRARYLGNVREIDSFASGTASEIMDDMYRERGRSSWTVDDSWNSRIDSLIHHLRYGGNGDQFEHYRQLTRHAFAGEYEHIGLNREQVTKVWKTFLKKVCQKLDDYKRDTHSKAQRSMPLPDRQDDVWPEEPTNYKLDPALVAIGRSKPFAEAVKEIAKREAAEIVAKDDWGDTVERVRRGNVSRMFEVELFLKRFYFGEDHQDRVEKVLPLFRQMTARYVERMLARKQQAA